MKKIFLISILFFIFSLCMFSNPMSIEIKKHIGKKIVIVLKNSSIKIGAAQGMASNITTTLEYVDTDIIKIKNVEVGRTQIKKTLIIIAIDQIAAFYIEEIEKE